MNWLWFGWVVSLWLSKHMEHKAGRLEQNVCFPSASFKLTGYAHMLPLAKLAVLTLDWSVKRYSLDAELGWHVNPLMPTESRTFCLWPLAMFAFFGISVCPRSNVNLSTEHFN